jgi:hypothetical protein
MMRRTVVVMFVLLAGPSMRYDSAAAQDVKWTQYGNFEVSCGTVTRSSPTQRSVYGAWAMGFLSGAGYAHAAAGIGLTTTDYDGGIAWIEKHCSERPLDTLADASIALVRELARRVAR